MAQTQSQSISQDKFLLMSANLLHQVFIDAARTEAKKVYRELTAGKQVHLTTVRMEDNSTARFNLALDHSEFHGRLNYAAFRSSVTTLIANLSAALQGKKELKMFNGEQGVDTMIFGVSAVTMDTGHPNVMVLGADTHAPEGATLLRLMYLDPAQFSDQA